MHAGGGCGAGRSSRRFSLCLTFPRGHGPPSWVSTPASGAPAAQESVLAVECSAPGSRLRDSVHPLCGDRGQPDRSARTGARQTLSAPGPPPPGGPSRQGLEQPPPTASLSSGHSLGGPDPRGPKDAAGQAGTGGRSCVPVQGRGSSAVRTAGSGAGAGQLGCRGDCRSRRALCTPARQPHRLHSGARPPPWRALRV